MTAACSPVSVHGDWHGHLGFALGAVDAASRAGVKTMIHVGDFPIDWPGPNRGRYEKKLNLVLVERDMTLILSPGNHDNWATIEKLPVQDDGLATLRQNIRVLPRGGRTVIDGLTVGGLGGAYSVDQKYRTEGRSWWANEEPTQEEADRLIAAGPVDILVTHDVPSSIDMKSGLKLPADVIDRAERTRILLDEVIRELRPPHLFAGHWHQRRSQELIHENGSITRVDVLADETSSAGNTILVWPNEALPLRIEPLKVVTR